MSSWCHDKPRDGDRVTCPARPEWGVGEITYFEYDRYDREIYLIRFEHGTVQLREWEMERADA